MSQLNDIIQDLQWKLGERRRVGEHRLAVREV